MSDVRFTVETRMEREDYRKFLYLATFRSNPLTLPLVAILALLGVLIVVGIRGWGSILYIAFMWALFFVLAVAGTCFMVELQNNRRFRNAGASAADSRSRITLYDDHMRVEVISAGESLDAEYVQLYKVVESKTFFIFYVAPGQALLLRKQDAEDVAGIRKLLKEACGKRYRSISKFQ